MAPKADAACDDKAPKDVDARLFSAIERFIGSWRTERNPSENTVRAYRIDLLDYAPMGKANVRRRAASYPPAASPLFKPA